MITYLVMKHTYKDTDITKVNQEEYTVTLPDDYIILLGDTAGISPADGVINNCWEKDALGNDKIKIVILQKVILKHKIELRKFFIRVYLKNTKAKPIKTDIRIIQLLCTQMVSIKHLKILQSTKETK